MKTFTCILFLFLILFFGTKTHAQKVYMLGEVDNEYQEDGRVLIFENNPENTPLNGKVRIISEEEPIMMEVDFDEGYANGKWIYYYENQLASFTTYTNGIRDGEFANYYSGGIPARTGTYKDGERTGSWCEYNEEGNMERFRLYRNDKLIHSMEYYPNGSIWSEKNYNESGQRHGTERHYQEDGTMTEEANYVDGERIGLQKIRRITDNGNITETWHSIEGDILHGEYIELYEATGHIRTKGSYTYGKMHGKWIYGNGEGTIYKEEVYDNGNLISSSED